MIRYYVIKFRLYPNPEQIKWFNEQFGACRFVYNQLLLRMKLFAGETPTIDSYHVDYYSTLMDDNLWLKDYDSQALNNTYRNLCDALNRWKKYIKRIGTPDGIKFYSHFPKFKKKGKCKDSYSSYKVDTVHINDINNTIHLPKVRKFGPIKIQKYNKRIHPDDDWKLKRYTVSKSKTNKFYISLLYQYEDDIKEDSMISDFINSYSNKECRIIGLDYKSNGLFVDSNGDLPMFDKMFRKYEKKLVKEQRKLSHMIGFKKGEKKSNNFNKQVMKIRKIHEYISNCREYQLHCISKKIANSYDVIVCEDINMKRISQCLHLGKSTMDNGYGKLRWMLYYKSQQRYPKQFILADAFYPSSQICSKCGSRQKISLSVRIYKCPNCGYVEDRDINAALNLKQYGVNHISNLFNKIPKPNFV